MLRYPVDILLLAAGLGERLRPVTNHLPKPLLPILGTPIIAGILERSPQSRMVGSGSTCTGPRKADLIRAWAAGTRWRNRITFFPEDPILGTGGALKHAESMLSRRAFLVHNSDIVLEIDFARLVEEHLSAGNLATLACHRCRT
jgi:mannose-1-phosphate guanylyltransferase